VIDQEPEFAFIAVESRGGQVWMSDGGVGDRRRVDRIGLALDRDERLAPAISLVGTRTALSPAPIKNRSRLIET
jgi:hypothetical protein